MAKNKTESLFLYICGFAVTSALTIIGLRLFVIFTPVLSVHEAFINLTMGQFSAAVIFMCGIILTITVVHSYLHKYKGKK